MSYHTSIIHAVTALRRATVPAPAIDTYRFPPPTTFGLYDRERALNVIEYIAAAADVVDATADAFADEASRALMRDLYAFMALGPHHVRLPTNCPLYWQQYEAAARLRAGPADLILDGRPLELFELAFDGEPVRLFARLGHVAFTFLRKQYVLERPGILIRPQPGDVVIDAGACIGDTALAFAAMVGPAGRVLSFDPVPAQVDIFDRNLSLNPHLATRISLVSAAVGDKTGDIVAFGDFGAASRPAQNGPIQAATVTIDDAVREQGLDRVDFIKMDIEGGEHAALLGARETIRRHRPVLAISAYHKPDDMLTLPRLIRDLLPDATLYLEHYTVHQEETVLFATCH